MSERTSKIIQWLGFSFGVADGVPTADTLLKGPGLMGPLYAMYLKGGSGPLGNIYYSSAHLPVPEFYGQAGREKVSSQLKEVSPDSSSKTIHNKLKEDAITNVLTHEDDAMIHYLLT